MNEREQNLYSAKLSEQCERYEDMAFYMKKVATSGIELCRNERVLFATAYKNVIGAKRTAFRLVISTIPEENNPLFREALLIAKQKIENEIDEVCFDVLELVQELLLTVTSTEYRIYLLKFKGDYTRYRCEMRKGQELNALIDITHECYMTATALANKCLPSVNQTRLGLALNFSVFFFEIVRDKARACSLARDAYEAALLELDMHPERLCNDSALILQLLRDNLTMWEELNSPTAFLPDIMFPIGTNSDQQVISVDTINACAGMDDDDMNTPPTSPIGALTIDGGDGVKSSKDGSKSSKCGSLAESNHDSGGVIITSGMRPKTCGKQDFHKKKVTRFHGEGTPVRTDPTY